MTLQAITTRDSSTRFVLSDDAPLLANLASLWTVDPALAREVDALDASTSYPTEPSTKGEPTLSVTLADGRQIRLHSRHDPLDEARRLIEGVPVAERAAFCVQGFGLGYHVRELFSRAGRDASLFVFEPDLLMLRTALERIDFSEMLLSNRVHFICRDDKQHLVGKLMPHSAAITMGFEPIIHPPSIELCPQFYRQIQTQLVEFASYCRTMVTTLMINGRRTSENIARNIGWYVASPDLARLKDTHAKQPAIIVSAGPSLRKNMHLLKDANGKAVIIAVQTTLQPLLEIGVRPQFVTSLDYHDICTRFFEKLPNDLETELIAEPKATEKIFDLHPGPTSILGNEFADALLVEMKIRKTRLTSGATVAHLAFYLAEHLGCDPIIFVGQDLGFSDGLCYSPGTSYEDVWSPELSRFCTLEMKQWEQIVRDRNILRRINDYQGRATYTEERLFTYLQHFERDFARTAARVIDATEGGVMKRGAVTMTLADALAQFCCKGIHSVAPQHRGFDWSRMSDCLTSLRNRRDEAKQIESISRQTLPLLEEIRDHLSEQPRVNQLISKIDVLRARMHLVASCYGLVMSLSQKSELKKYHADYRISAGNLDAESKQQRQVERDLDNVRSVIEASAAFQSLMDEAIERVSAHMRGRTESARLLEAA